jgi:hypothetical protein
VLVLHNEETNKRETRIPKGQSKMDNPEKLATFGTQYTRWRQKKKQEQNHDYSEKMKKKKINLPRGADRADTEKSWNNLWVTYQWVISNHM